MKSFAKALKITQDRLKLYRTTLHRRDIQLGSLPITNPDPDPDDIGRAMHGVARQRR